MLSANLRNLTHTTRTLPPKYAPELNPVEGVWANGKEVKLRGVVSDDIDDLEVNAHIALEDITADQPLLRSFFRATPLVIPGVST